MHPQEIDSRAEVGLNLNQLEALKSAEMIDSLKPDKVYVDSPTTPRPEKFAEFIRAYMKTEPGVIIAEHRADLKYVQVGAASILAKVTRDAEIEKIKREVGMDFGSGYPADPITKRFVEEHWEDKLAKYIRKSWATIKTLEHNKAQSKLDF